MTTTVIVPKTPEKKVKILPAFPALYKAKESEYTVLVTSEAGGVVVVSSPGVNSPHPVGYVYPNVGCSWSRATAFERITEPTTIKFED